MANEFRKVTDQNGVDHPVTDDTRVTWTANGVLGAENILMPNTLADIKAQNTTGTWNNNVYSLNNVEFTINTNGTVSVSITGSVSTNAVLRAVYKLKAVNGIEYTISDFLSNVDREKIRLWANSSTAFPAGKRLTTGTETVYQSRTQIAMADEDVPTSIEILNGATLGSAVVFKGMVSLDTDPTYQPHAMTNKELTDAVQGITVKKFTSAELNISAGQYSAQELNIANGDLIPLGVVGYTISGNNNTECTMWKNWMDSASKKVFYGVKNNGTATQATVTVDIFVLYKG